jgi:hypothetical protein
VTRLLVPQTGLPDNSGGGQNFSGDKTCVSGWTCQVQNPYYSQCLQSTGGGGGNTGGGNGGATTIRPATTTTRAGTSPTPSSGGGGGGSTGSGTTYKSSFTFYGAGDTFGSPNCNTNTAACGFYTNPGFSAAASQNIFGVGPGAVSHLP